ncbi:DUF2530 domain-containing protein [Sphaerisporangium aureirubrum]|uniref:DUF2530 domain-containing protein n=1 Tax=Sphaerisporangium aureirubrum TaxID=1544736 RepID=A0ABW1NUU5_9ACTN
MNEPRPPDLAPLKTNDAATILAGTGLWAVALIVLLIVQPGPDRQWWIWTCVAGIGLGLFGVWHVRRRDRREGLEGHEGPESRTTPPGDGDGTGEPPRRQHEDSGGPARLSGHRDQP